MHAHLDTIAHLWSAARTMFARLRDAVGDAAALAARHALSDDERRAIRAWLRPLEAMARKIVLTQALALIERGDTHARAAAAKSSKGADMRVCHPAHLGLTLIRIPPQVCIVTQAATPPPAHTRAPSLRLWPRASSSNGPRVRNLGPHRLVRGAQCEQARLAFARRMSVAPHRPEPERLARRIDALARLIDKPARAAGRLARALARRPTLALKLAFTRPPRTRLYTEPEYDLAHVSAGERVQIWSMRRAPGSG